MYKTIALKSLNFYRMLTAWLCNVDNVRYY